VSPVFGALACWALFLLARELLGPRWAKGVVLLALISPFWLVTYASMMSHPGSVLTLTLFAYFFVRSARRPDRWRSALLAGLFLGLSANFRPYSSLLICGVVIVGALAAGWWRNVRLGNSLAFFIGLGVFVGVLLGYNKALTGDAFVTPFAQWSPYDRLGFGPDRGQYDNDALGFTVGDSWINQRIRLHSLGQMLTGWSSATLLLLLFPLFARRYRGRCAVLLLILIALMVGHFFYFFGFDFVYGPRYWAEALPACLILVAVGLAVLRKWVRNGLRLAGVRAASAGSRAMMPLMILLLMVGSVWSTVPAVLAGHDDTMWHISSAPHRAVQEAGLTNAVVFIATPYYRTAKFRPDRYGSGFTWMSPDLDDDVIYARDLGDEKNRELMALMPGRKFYRLRTPTSADVELSPYDNTGQSSRMAGEVDK
jgi:4-amino-4-deoxy-L-arabinose transferase-like glycosyltransferase